MRRWILLLAAITLPFLLWCEENFFIRVQQVELRHETIRQSVRIVHISDLHGLNWGSDNAGLLRLIAAQHPDMICVTGDMFTRGSVSEQHIAESLLFRLRAYAPTYFVPGEHDRSPDYLKNLTDNGIQIPDLTGTPIHINSTQLHIYGCSAAWFPYNADYSERLAPANPDAFRLLLCHIPAPQAFDGAEIDLMLSGDTHGGLIRLPLLGAVFYGERWFPELRSRDNCWIYGEYTVDNMTLSVTSGLGGLPARLFSPPEIRVITLLPS